MNLDSIKFCCLGVTLFANLAITPLQWRSWLLKTLRTSFRCEKVSLSYHVCLHHWQCAIPAFEDLLPWKHDRIVWKLLFELATLHGLVKLQLHTESTLNNLENSATQLGNLLQTFKTDVCSEYATRDLPSEEAACGRCQAAKAQKGAGGAALPTNLAAVISKFHGLNMETYKLHAYPDYAASIRVHGVTENTSSKNVCYVSFIWATDLSNMPTGRKQT